jgi:hypothetical protein
MPISTRDGEGSEASLKKKGRLHHHITQHGTGGQATAGPAHRYAQVRRAPREHVQGLGIPPVTRQSRQQSHGHMASQGTGSPHRVTKSGDQNPCTTEWLGWSGPIIVAQPRQQVDGVGVHAQLGEHETADVARATQEFCPVPSLDSVRKTPEQGSHPKQRSVRFSRHTACNHPLVAHPSTSFPHTTSGQNTSHA